MKKRKGLILVIALLLVMVTGGIATLTYSRYTSSATGNGTATVAPWVVKVNSSDIVANNTFDINSINWSSSDNISDGYIAPGRTGTFDITIDPTGSKVAVDYSISIDTTQLTNDNMTISSVKVDGVELTATNGVYSDSISLAEVEAGTSKTVTVTITWTDANTDSANTADTTTGSSASDIQIPVTVTATQKVA